MEALSPEKKRLLFAASLGLLGAILGWAYLYLQERALLHRGQNVRVLVASHSLTAYTRLSRRDLESLELPLAYVPRSAVSDAAELLGKRTLVPFAQGELLLFNKIGEEGVTLASAVPEGCRALSLAVDEVSGLAGLLQPGDRVDLFSVETEAGNRAGVLLQQVQVLAVGARSARENKPAEGNRAPNTVTLAVPESEAALVLLASARSVLHLGLRAPGDERPLSQTRALPADLERRLAQAPLRARAALPAEKADDDFVPHKR